MSRGTTNESLCLSLKNDEKIETIRNFTRYTSLFISICQMKEQIGIRNEG